MKQIQLEKFEFIQAMIDKISKEYLKNMSNIDAMALGFKIHALYLTLPKKAIKDIIRDVNDV